MLLRPLSFLNFKYFIDFIQSTITTKCSVHSITVKGMHIVFAYKCSLSMHELKIFKSAFVFRYSVV